MNLPLAFIIEDDERLAEIFSMSLQSANYATEIAADGAKALTRLGQIVPNIVVLDLHLPHVGGPEILHHIRGDARLTKTVVILTTADDQLAETLQDQADLVLLKPVSPEQLRLLAARLRPMHS